MQTTNPAVPVSGTPPSMLLTAREAAAFLRISERKLWSLTKAHEIRCVRIGRAVRYSPDDVEAYIATHRDAGR